MTYDEVVPRILRWKCIRMSAEAISETYHFQSIFSHHL